MSTVIGMIVMLTMIGEELLFPLFMQNARGYTALESGVMLLRAIVMGSCPR
ncbi:hypothetical protein [Peribacillus butanolivorans]|uniref:hypothetical protein n=1 Tax=Peribacillus butanolivorans TaxID=421767 RepID=UPI003810C842